MQNTTSFVEWSMTGESFCIFSKNLLHTLYNKRMWHSIYIVLQKNSKITMVHFQKHGIAIAMFKNLANSIFIAA